ncbi:hypothetical protein BH11MYX4_BH11MYX4_37700 [soil metagenome]
MSTRTASSGLFTMLAIGVLGSTVGCSKPAAEKTAAWSCANDEVPMGSVVRCTSSALTSDGPVGSATGGTTNATTDGTIDTGTTGGTTDGTTTATTDGTVYECPPGTDNPDCPPSGSSDGTTNGGTSDGTTSGGTSDGTTNGGTSDGTTNGGTSDGTTNGGTSGGAPPGNDGSIDECEFVPDLEYCGGSGSGSSSSGGAAGSDCGKPVCSPPGQDKKNDGTTNGGGASSSGGGSGSGASSSSGGSGGGDKHFTCTKDGHGNKACVSTPDCAKGTHASACGACVSDSDGTADCVPPTEGGCWVTGGGFIEGASLVPAAPADGHDNFGGNAKPMRRGDVSGHWNHVDHGTGNHALGRPEYIMCRTTEGAGPGQPGGKKGLVANQVYFGGHAKWRTAADAIWSDGYWFDVVAEDHGEPGNTSAKGGGAHDADSYHFTLRKMDDPTAKVSGAIVYETRGDLTGGNIQLHPSNGGHPAVSSPLPAWVSLEP